MPKHTQVLGCCALMSLLLVGACTEPTAPLGVAIHADDVAFDKVEILLPSDHPVEIELANDDSVPHSFAMDVFASNIVEQGSKTHLDGDGFWMEVPMKRAESVTLDDLEPGTYDFYCKLHPKVMRGTVTVES